jgi:hypothetical protein
VTPASTLVAAWLVAIACGVIAVWPRRAGARGCLVAGVVAVAVALACVPLRRWSLVGWLVALAGAPSVSSLVLLIAVAWERLTGRAVLDARAWRTAFRFLALAAVSLYPMSLGLGRFDPYALGWNNVWMLAALWAVSVWLLLSGDRFGVVLLLAVLAFNVRLLESSNLWDYLIDPPLAAVALLVVAAPLRRMRAQRPRPAPDERAAA